MNFYKHHIGDYTKKTGHLSVTEHGAYHLMLSAYYATERPLPVGKPLYHLLRANTRLERAAVDSVSRQFWTETPDGLINGRADEEIARANHQREVNRELGKRGGRPKASHPKTDSVSDSRTESKANHNPTPDSRLQTPSSPPSGESARGRAPAPRASRKAPKDWAPSPEQIATMRAECPGVDIEAATRAFRDHEFKAARSDWDGTWRNWIRREQRDAPRGGRPRPTRYEELMGQAASATPPAGPSPALEFLMGGKP